MKAHQISLIIPVIDEASSLPQLFDDLATQAQVDLEILIIDGGSTDDTVPVARARGARVLTSERGRGRQMNLGARKATHDLLLFLHADSRLNHPRLLADAVSSFRAQEAELATGNLAGHFQLEFICEEGPGGDMYRFLEAKSALNRPYTFNGDQGLLIERGFFETLGGFDESLPMLEDQRIGREIHRHGQWMTLPGKLGTSARRFETEGFGPRYTLMAVMMGAFVAECDEFFEALPHIYPDQKDTQAIELTPFLLSLYGVLKKMGPRGSARAFYEVGCFVRENAWQLALLADVIGESPKSMLEWFDEDVAHRLEHPLFDLLAGVLTFATIFGVLPAKGALTNGASLARLRWPWD